MEASNKFFYKLTAGLAAIALGLGVGAHSLANLLHEKKQLEQLVQDQERMMEEKDRIIEDREQKTRVSELIDEDREVFEYFKEDFKIITQYVPNQEGKSVKVTDLIKESLKEKETKRYARKLAKTAYKKNKGKKFKTKESKIQLAKGLVDNAREHIQLGWCGGQGTYSLAYEYQKGFTSKELLAIEGEMNKTKCTEDQEECQKYRQMLKKTLLDGHSVQTYSQFYGPKNGKNWVGDCDDFSTTLTTMYHAVKEYAEKNKEKNNFYRALAEGLDHYRVYSIEVIKETGKGRHWLNLSATIRDVPYFQVIEPQIKSKIIDIEFRPPSGEEGNKVGGAVIKYQEDGKDIERKISRLFNKDLYAHLKDDI